MKAFGERTVGDGISWYYVNHTTKAWEAKLGKPAHESAGALLCINGR
jgi:hypothetical protein